MACTRRKSGVPHFLHFVAFACASTSLGGESLIVNPSFEEFVVDDAGAVFLEEPIGTFTTRADLVGWDEELGEFSLERYDGQFAPITGSQPGAGTYLLYGANVPQSRLRQTIDVGFAAGTIDAGQGRYVLSAFLGGYFGGPFPDTQNDFATVAVRFLTLDRPAALLREDVLVGPTRPSDVGLPESFNARSYSVLLSRRGDVPVGTDRIEIVVFLQRDLDALDGTFNHANVDKIDFQFVPPGCLGDANADGLIDGRDVSVLLSQFGTPVTPGTGADFNADGVVDGRDLSVLLAAFGSSC